MSQIVSITRKRVHAQISLSAVHDLVRTDMQQLDHCIRERLSSEVALINHISEYIIGSGGKRIRPQLLILTARACGNQSDKHVLLAAIIEFIHTATLLHDDVVDESELRRGQETAHSIWGNAASVLVGDFLYSRSFQMMVELDSMRIMKILAETTNTIAAGEVQQLLHLQDPELDEASYMNVIGNKTAKLFEAACQLGALISEQDAATEAALALYGRYLGQAFQIADDILDYDADAQTTGKNIGDDLAEGKTTLPLIYAREMTTATGREILDRAIRNGDASQLGDVMEIIHHSGAMDRARQCAFEISDQALECLHPVADSPYREALVTLCHFASHRPR